VLDFLAALGDPLIAAILIPLVMLLTGACARKLIRGPGWKRHDFYLGVEFSLAALSAGLANLSAIAARPLDAAAGAEHAISLTALFSCQLFPVPSFGDVHTPRLGYARKLQPAEGDSLAGLCGQHDRLRFIRGVRVGLPAGLKRSNPMNAGEKQMAYSAAVALLGVALTIAAAATQNLPLMASGAVAAAAALALRLSSSRQS
jgi:hypothetical protein